MDPLTSSNTEKMPSDDLLNLLGRFESVLNYCYKPLDENMSKEEKSFSDSFFTEIYVSRPYHEKNIKRFCQKEIGSFGMVVGVPGSGKSTIIQKACRDIKPVEQSPFLVIDFGDFYPQQLATKDNINEWRQIIEDCLKDKIDRLFLGEEGVDKYFLHFLYEHNDPNGVFGEVRRRIRRHFHRAMDMKGGKQDFSKRAEKKWFKKKQARFVLLANSISKKLNLAHFFEAARLETKSTRRFVIVFDNVDRVPRNHQSNLYQVAEDMHRAYSSFAHTLITTRKETCHPPHQVIGFCPDIITEIGICNELGNGEANLTTLAFHEILKQRLQYALKKCGRTKLTNQLVGISLSLHQGYSNIVLIDLANQSIREALHYHCKFVRYLVEEYISLQQLRNHIKTGGEAFLNSCLYGWVAQHRDVINWRCLNIVDLLDRCKKNNFVDIIGCDLSYLILVCLHNFKSRERHRLISVAELLSRFRRLAHSNDEIRVALFELWAMKNQDFGHVINIYQKVFPKSGVDIKDDAKLELNLRGNKLIGEVSISFTFINRLLYDKFEDYLYPVRIRNKINHYYDIKHLVDHAYCSCQFLYRLAFLHSLELHKIRSRYNCTKWRWEYATDFCINGEFHLERIINNHKKFLDKAIDHHASNEGVEWKNKMVRVISIMEYLQKIYGRQVDLLTLENKNDKWLFDFDRILEQIQRGYITTSDVDKVCTDQYYRKNISDLL